MIKENNFEEWKKTFTTDAPKPALEERLAQDRKELIELSKAMTQRMSEEEHITIQLKLKSKEEQDGIS